MSFSHRGEISACMLGLSTFCHLLLLAPFRIRSDSISVRYLSNIKDQCGPMPRYYSILADFTFTAEHRAGCLNQPEKSISRRDNLPEMNRFDFVDQMTPNSQLEALEDLSIEFAGPYPTTWNPNLQAPCLPHDLATSDIATPCLTTSSVCFDLHPKLQFLNEIQSQSRGKVGKNNQDSYLTEMVPRTGLPPVASSVSSSSPQPVASSVSSSSPQQGSQQAPAGPSRPQQGSQRGPAAPRPQQRAKAPSAGQG